MIATQTREAASREAQLERVWSLVEAVLSSYPLGPVKIRLLEQKKNVTFRLDELAADGREAVPNIEPQRYVMRVCEIGEGGYDEAEIRSELQYLLALRQATGLIVPEPVPARDGSLLVRSEVAGLPPRYCALFRWVPGRMVEDAPTPQLLEKVGELAARIHRFSEGFTPPPGFSRPRWDAARLFGEGRLLAPGQGEPLISGRARELLEQAAQAVREQMVALGEEREVFGLIHKDLEPDNTLVYDGEVHAIDFADLGWGYYLYDIAASLLPLREKPGFSTMREAFLRGYNRVRPLRPEHAELVETFLIARSMFAVRLMTGKLWDLPQIREYANTAVPQILGGIRRFLETRAGAAPRGAAGATRTTVQFLSHLRSLGARVWAEGDKLRFSAPKDALGPDLLAELKERKIEVLNFLRQGYVARRSAAPSRLTDAAAGGEFPLSFAQQRLWFIDRLFPGSPQYNIARAVRLKGRVRVDLLARALNLVVERHAALRTTFGEAGGRPVQRIAPQLRVPLPVVDLEGIPEPLRMEETWRLATADARRPFDLAAGPLLRVFLLRLDATDFVAPSTMHHIVGDGWSSGILFREMGALYGALLAGAPSPLPELPIQYADFAVWQRDWLQGEVLAEQLAYWKRQLAGAPQLLELPTDRPRAAARSPRGDRQALLVPEPLTEALRSFAQAQGATLFMILLAAFKALLSRYSGQEDVVVGSPIANRNWTEVEGLIGFFANTLVLRAATPWEGSFRQLLGAVRKTTLEAYAHQDLPFEKIVEELRPERSGSDTPLFQVVLTLQNVPYPDMQVADFRMTLMSPTSRAAIFDLTCNMKEMPEGVRTSFMYRQELFDAPTVARLARHYLRLLEVVGADPNLRLWELPLLAAAERHQVLGEWNAAASFPPAACLHELFARRAAERGGAVAVVCGAESLTYADLEVRANRLAHLLRACGVGPEVPVGLCLERSLDMVVAILGVLKAGGAYLPLDPAYPRERLAFILADARPPVLLTQEPLRELLPDCGARTLCLDAPEAGSERGREEPPAAPASGVGLDNLAYIIYTSGSTGRPKGSLVTHRNAVRLFAATDAWFGFGADDVWTLFHSYAFDFSVWELWGALLYGGRLVVVPYWVSRSPADFYQLLAREGVTVLNQTPSAFRQLVRAEEEAAAALRERLRLRAVIFGGEALDLAALAPWFDRHGDRRPRLVNMYGITETTVHVSYRPLARGDLREPWRSPIGLPISDLRLYVLDRQLNPVPLGVTGEMYVGGPGLARGYLGRPGLTAERFVPDPFSAGGRLYRTGDFARVAADGGLDYLGRIDHQVKIRGFRIELGEIEAALAQHPSVREAVVLAREDSPGERRLVAYVALRPAAPVETAALRAALRESLPDYMVPAAFVLLDALPLNANGKVDRRALERLSPEAEPAAALAADAPRGPVEELLAGLWAEVLGVEGVGREDDFFALGGHSLLATQVVSRVRDAFGVEVPLQRLFETPTLAELAATLAELHRPDRAAAAPPILPVPRDGDLPLSFAQQRLWFLDSFEPGRAVYNIPLAVRLVGRLDAGSLAAACREVARRHEALRTTFAARDGRPVQVIAAASRLELPLVDLRDLPAAARAAAAAGLAAEEAGRPFDLARGPLVRAALLQLAGEEHLALVTFHHIVADGWSLGLFVQELATLYRAYTRGEPSPLPELPVQYADFASWQRRWLAGDVLAAELAYWRQQLAGAGSNLELPTDRPRPAVQTFCGGRLEVAVPRALAAALSALSRREGATLFITLLAAFQLLLARLERTADVAVGTPIAGRNRREIEGLIGFFVNTLVLRADLGGEPTGRELLARARRTALDAYDHQDVPFERLVEELQPERDLSFNPLFQVVLALQNPPRGALALPGLTLETLPGQGGTAKFDLTLSLQETDDGLRGTLEHNADLFDPPTVARWWESFSVLLAALVEAPERPASSLPWLTAAARHQTVVDWNATGTNGAADACLHELFEAQAARSPEAPAVIRGTLALTYGKLAERSGRLARRLRALGVGPEVRVGVCLERDLDLVVSLYAVLRAGGAYVPLDPAYPAERLAFMMEDAAVRVLITREALLPRLSVPAGTRLCLEGDLAAAELAVAGPSGVAPDHLAYVIYTSGSTGRPKGVAIAHRSAVALARWAREVFPAAELDGVLASTSVCFDVSVFELFVPLAWGGRIVLAQNALELADLGPLAGGAEVRVATMVPSAVAELARQDALPLSVRTLGLGGEALAGALVERLHRLPAVRRVLNLYGPTEDTTYSTWEEVGRGGEPTLGRPVRGTRAYVLDDRFEPVPVGVPGELYLGGEGLSRGYLGRPARTAASYLPDPWSGLAGERLYRTGDLARWLPDATLQYLGRRDHQVKVRGFRIELGEIEVALDRHPQVRAAAVVVREDRSGDRRLVAFVTAEPGEAPTPDELRAALRERLPDPMIPAAFVLLAALPLTPNGKLDRRALARQPLAAAAPAAAAAAPRDATEEILAGIWAEVLGRTSVAPEDDFFALGGHSLLAIQVVSRVREVFAVELPVQQLFAAPTCEALAALVSAARRSGEEAEAPIPPAARDAALPLSFAQQRLWFLDRLRPGSAAYNVPAAARLRGPLPPGLLARAFAEVVRRHEVLRTTFAESAAGPAQIVAPAASSRPVPLVDLGGLPAAEREPEARRLARGEARRPFDLAAGPLLRTVLLRLDPDDHVALVTLHHVVADGWSAGVLLRELAALTAAFSRGEPSPLPPLPIQYADFAVWQRERLAGERLEAELAFWRQLLAGMPRTLALPLDRPRTPLPGSPAAVRTVELPPRLRDDLAALGRREGATLFMVLLAAFQALLGRLSGQQDFAVGTPVAGRDRRELEPLIGCFVNTLTLRADLSGDPDVPTLLARVRSLALDVYAHQELPFERLVEELQPERDLAQSPLFQVAFTLQAEPLPEMALPGVVIQPFESASGTAKFDLTLGVRDAAAGLAASLEYNADLLNNDTIVRLLSCYDKLLAGMTAAAGRPVGEIPLWSETELRQILEESCGGPVAGELECVHRQVERWAAADPGRPALLHGGGIVSYGELNAGANQLARRLRSLRVGPEVPVAVCLPRSPQEVTALLAVLKAGGAYLPLDPAHPAERLASLVRDAGAAVLIAAGSPAWSPASVLLLDPGDEASALAALSGEDLAGGADLDHLAYIIYTSGSTGRAKGVEIGHRTLAGLLAWHRRAFAVTPADRATRVSGLAFDAAVWELWPYLTAGASVAIPGEEVRTAPAALRDWLLAEAVTATFASTPVAESLLALDWPDGSPLRLLLTGGDELHRGPARPLPFRLINNYGPTEGTVVSTSGEVAAAAAGRPDIGRPIDGVRALLLDRWLRPVPTGGVGELCIGGNLARGYSGLPERTAERFVPDPFGAPGERLYRTGDLARRLPGGALRFLGRVDAQVKVRGYRIEPAEVEAVLASHPAVRECAVVLRDEVRGDRRLVSYLVGEALPAAAELRAHCARQLPEPMIPAAFVRLAALPLTSNGKVDRAALPTPERSDLGERYAAPRDLLELSLARLWEELLGIAPVGIRDDFFALGGHSLLAVRLLARIREELQRDLPLAVLFPHPTVEHLAALVREAERAPRRTALVLLQPGGALPPWFLVHPVGGNVLCYLDLARRLGAERPVYGLQVPEPGARLSIEALADLYLTALRTVQPEGPYHLAGWSFGGAVAFEMGRRLGPADVARLALLDPATPASITALRELPPAARVEMIARDLAALAGVRPPALDLAGLEIDAALHRVLDYGRGEGILPAGIELADLREFFSMFWNNVDAMAEYVPSFYPGHVLLLQADERPDGESEEPAALWGRLAGTVDVLRVPGTHHTLLTQPQVTAALATRPER